MHYNCALTVDCVVFSGDGAVLIKRKNPPFKGAYALPGGFVEEDETVEEACIRETMEETGLAIERLRLVGVYSTPGRDPRGRMVSVAFVAEADLGSLQAGDDAADTAVVKDWEHADLAFDHKQIISDALKTKEAPED